MMCDGDELQRLVDDLAWSVSIVVLLVALVWLIGTVTATIVREQGRTRRAQAETERVRIERSAETDQARIKAQTYRSRTREGEQ